MSLCSLAPPLSIRPVSLENVRRLLLPHPLPCLSLYLPTHRNVPHNTVDLPAFRHLVEALDLAIAGSINPAAEERLLQPLRQLQDRAAFWQHTRDGLAVLAADGAAEVFLLQQPVKPLAVATNRFHTMPLLQAAASVDRFNLLTLTSRTARVYEGVVGDGGVERIDPVPLHAEVTTAASAGELEISRAETVDAEVFQPHRVQRGMGPAGLGFGSIVHGGTGSKQDDTDADTEIFFRHVDEVVHERVTKHSGLPLVLAALPRLGAVFRSLSKNRMLLADGVTRDVHLVPEQELGPLIAPLLTAARTRRIARAVASFAEAHPHGLGSGDLSDVARAAAAGRVATLLVEKDRFEAGALDPASGVIAGDGMASADLSRRGAAPAARTGDRFGTVAEMVLVHGGGVMALDRNDMPTESGVAAVYRW